MSKQYCFDINNPKQVNFDPEDLKKFVSNIYVGKKSDQFSKDEKIPFFTIYSRSDNSVCIVMTSQGKKNIERIESINKNLKTKDLQWKDSINLNKPYFFDVDVSTWWEDMQKGKKGKKWTSLRQQGPYFKDLLEPYKPLGASLIYEKKKYKLTSIEEKIASMYARRMISEAGGGIAKDAEWTKDKVFNDNFWTDFKQYLTPQHKAIFKDFNKIGWGDLISLMESEKAGEMTDAQKLARRIQNEERKKEYGYAFLDGKREKVGNFIVEPQAIFYGRGKNPNRGKIKAEIFPEDVTINVGPKDPVPKAPTGHKWGDVVHDQNAVWLARWKDSITGEVKYVMFSTEGRFKGEADFMKYEIARKLQLHINTIRDKYMLDAASSNKIKMQLGTVLYLIDHFGVRVGNEKKEDEADTVGASTLRVGHVKMKPPNHVIFDFLGKDSVRFFKDLEVPPLIYHNFEILLSDKNKEQQVFDSISSRSINIYLKEFDKDFYAKVFRTRLASSIMYEALKNVHIPKENDPKSENFGNAKKLTKFQTKNLFNKANIKVADVLNHTRTVSKKAEDAVAHLRDQLKEAEAEKKGLLKKKSTTTTIDNKIQKLREKIEAKTDTMAVAMTTSLTNYIDPRIVVSWSKSEDADLSAIYTAALMRKFKWAIDSTDAEWDWMTSPLAGNPELEPAEGEGSAEDVSVEDKVKKSKTRKNTKKTAPKKTKKQKLTPEESDDEDEPVKPPPPAPKSTSPDQKIEGYELLLKICEEPEKYKWSINKVPKNVLSWVYPFSKYAEQKGSTVIANKYIIQYYEKVNNTKKAPQVPKESSQPSKPLKSKTKSSKQKAPTPPTVIPAEYTLLKYMNLKELKELCADRKINCDKMSRNSMLRAIIDSYEQEPYRKFTKEQLKAICIERGIDCEGLNLKSQLIEAIEKSES